jgi:hypothetical protein
MYRIIFIYGIIAGAIAIATMTISILAGVSGLVVGYLILFAALSLIFVSIKRYRDDALGGVIRFTTAARLGLGIAAVATIVYVIGWELYLWSTGYVYLDHYAAAEIERQRAAGVSAAELARLSREMAAMTEQYNSQPLMRFGFTLLEILPVGLVVTLISAALLRNSGFLPARGRRTTGA